MINTIKKNAKNKGYESSGGPERAAGNKEDLDKEGKLHRSAHHDKTRKAVDRPSLNGKHATKR